MADSVRGTLVKYLEKEFRVYTFEAGIQVGGMRDLVLILESA